MAEMSDDAEKRMGRLRDELADIRQDYKRLSFTIVTCSSQIPIGWTVQEEQFLCSVLSNFDPGILTLRNSNDRTVFDPLPDRKACIVWHYQIDDASGVERLTKWGENCSRFFECNPDFAGRFHYDTSKGGFGSVLLAFSEFARVTPKLSRLVAEPVVLDLAEKEMLRIPLSLQRVTPLPSFSILGFDRLDRLDPSFLLEVIDHVLGKRSGPRLTVDVANNTATLDGVTYHIDWQHVLILDALVQANGNPVTRSRMQQIHPRLVEFDHLERQIKDLKRDDKCPPIGKLIESARGRSAGYWIPREYLG